MNNNNKKDLMSKTTSEIIRYALNKGLLIKAEKKSNGSMSTDMRFDKDIRDEVWFLGDSIKEILEIIRAECCYTINVCKDDEFCCSSCDIIFTLRRRLFGVVKQK